MNLPLQEWRKKALNKESIIIDVRTSIERENGFIEKSLHMDFYDAPNFMRLLSKLDPSKEYYLYCRSGVRGNKACIVFKNEGFTKVFNLIGGYEKFRKEM